MSTSDAVEDVTGKPATLTEAFGGSMSGLRERKFQAFAESTGVNIDELRGLAAGDITYDAPLRTGTVSLADTLDEPVQTSFLNKFKQTAVVGLGGKGNIIDGEVQTSDMQNANALAALDIAAEANQKFREFQKSGGPDGGPLSETEAYVKTQEFIKTEAARRRNQLEDPNTGTDKLSDMSGIALPQLPGRILSELKGADDKSIMGMQLQAEKILRQAYLDAGELPQVAASEARKQMDRIRKELEKQ